MNTEEKQKLISDFVTENREKLYRTAYMYLSEREASLDALHDAIVNALKSAGGLRQPEYVGTWFYRILINKCNAQLNKRHRFTELSEETESVPEKDSAEIMDLYKGISELEPQQKAVIILRYFEDMKIGEIAKVLNSNESTIKSRMKAALGRLRIKMEVL